MSDVTDQAGSLLRLVGVSKSFGATRALDDVSLEVRRGEIHGIVGHNGAGKSTLVKILMGYHAADDGAIYIKGVEQPKPVRYRAESGLAVVQQDRALIEEMSVADNVGVAMSGGRVDLWRPVRRHSEAVSCGRILREMGLSGITGKELVKSLPENLRPIVAIVRALRVLEESGAPGILVLDEPTASLTAATAQLVLDVMRNLSRRGHGVVFISHRLVEVLDVCDRVTVLRDGRLVAERAQDELTKDELVSLISGSPAHPEPPVGAELPANSVRARTDSGGPAPSLFQAIGLRSERLSGVNVEVFAGEVLGVTGLSGSGFEDVIPALLREENTSVDGIVVHKQRLRRGGPAALRRAGVAIVPRDRKRRGLWMGADATQNLTVTRLDMFSHQILRRLSRRQEVNYARSLMRLYRVLPPAPESLVDVFSGGNQQKLVFARELGSERGSSRVVVADEPVEAVDVATRAQIVGLLREISRRGGGVLISSGDMEFLVDVADRVLVFGDGVPAAELVGDAITDRNILALS